MPNPFRAEPFGGSLTRRARRALLARMKSTVRRRALALCAGLLLALLVAEIVCRIDAFFPGSHYASDSARRFFDARATPHAVAQMRAYGRPDPQLSEEGAQPFVHPFAGWSNVATDEFAAQMARETAVEDPRFFDLLVLGGSVAGDFAGSGAVHLASMLEADARLGGRSVRVWGFARPSHRAPQPLGWCEWLLALGARPDAVLIIDGFNEAAMSLENARLGSHPAYPAFHYWSPLASGSNFDPESLDLVADVRIARREQLRIAARARDWGFHNSALLTRISESRLRGAKVEIDAAAALLRARQAAGAADDVSLRGPPFVGDDRTAVEVAVECWASAARSLHAVCAARDIPCLQIVQPTLADAGSKRPTEDERRNASAIDAWREGVEIGYPMLRERARELSAAGLHVVDATRAFAEVDETLFTDVVHFDEHGNRVLADWIAPRLLALLPE